MRGKRRFAVSTAVPLAMVATVAACGGDDSGDDATGATTATTAAARAARRRRPATATTAAAKEPTSIEEWEKLWADQRAAAVKSIKDNKWGKSADGKTRHRARGLHHRPRRSARPAGADPRA